MDIQLRPEPQILESCTEHFCRHADQPVLQSLIGMFHSPFGLRAMGVNTFDAQFPCRSRELCFSRRVSLLSIDSKDAVFIVIQRYGNGERTMSNRFKKAVIDDVLQASLLDLFESAMKTVATTLVREAKFDISDFASTKERGCEGFELLIRARADSRSE